MKLQAAGRVLSSLNASRLKGLFSEIGSILIDAKVLRSGDLKRILDSELGELAEELEESTEIEAGKLGDMIRRNSFQKVIDQSLDSFRFCLTDLVHISEDRVKKQFGDEKSRLSVAQEMIDDLAAFLKEQLEQLPEPMDSGYPFDYPVYASAKLPVLKEELTLEPKETIEVVEVVVQPEDSGETDLIFRCQIREDIQASASNGGIGNKMPIQGVLFLVDEVSEFAPSKGSDYPLYVPYAIAEIAAEAINESGGLPLDADDSLKQHANQQIVGVMTSASLVGNEFWVSGHLFPWNNKEKVSLINANSKVLGMSMNAHARTHHEVIDGVKVSCVDNLSILGANILYAEKATYQKTKVLLPGQVIAASNQEQLTEENMDVEKQFESIRGMLTELIADSKVNSMKLNEIETRALNNEKVIAEIQAERQTRDSTIAAQQREEEEKGKQTQLLQAVGKLISENNEALKDEIIASVGGNRRQQPQRRAGGLVDIVAQGTATAGTINPVEMELIQAQAGLQTLRDAGLVGPERARLIEKISSLKAQLSQA